MNTEYHKWWSNHLNRDMELKVYGHAGIPIMVFPCSSGRFFDFEDRGMYRLVENHINEGRICFYAVDSIDPESWDNKGAHPVDRARRHNDYDAYIVNEVVPFIKGRNPEEQRIIATGTSMGASHSVLFFLKHPDIFGGTVALSGIYDFSFFLGGDFGDNQDVYYNSPLSFLPNLNDEWFLNHYRNSKIIVCVGQGAWEDEMLRDTKRLKEIFDEKSIPNMIEIWGYDVNHDWPWWEKQFPMFIDRLIYD